MSSLHSPATEVVVEADDVFDAMLAVPPELARRFGGTVPFTFTQIADVTEVAGVRQPARVTVIARP